MITPAIETKALYLALASNVHVCNTFKGFELSKNDKVEFVPFSNNSKQYNRVIAHRTSVFIFPSLKNNCLST